MNPTLSYARSSTSLGVKRAEPDVNCCITVWLNLPSQSDLQALQVQVKWASVISTDGSCRGQTEGTGELRPSVTQIIFTATRHASFSTPLPRQV